MEYRLINFDYYDTLESDRDYDEKDCIDQLNEMINIGKFIVTDDGYMYSTDKLTLNSNFRGPCVWVEDGYIQYYNILGYYVEE